MLIRDILYGHDFIVINGRHDTTNCLHKSIQIDAQEWSI